jgi:hypothetical protein
MVYYCFTHTTNNRLKPYTSVYYSLISPTPLYKHKLILWNCREKQFHAGQVMWNFGNNMGTVQTWISEAGFGDSNCAGSANTLSRNYTFLKTVDRARVPEKKRSDVPFEIAKHWCFFWDAWTPVKKRVNFHRKLYCPTSAGFFWFQLVPYIQCFKTQFSPNLDGHIAVKTEPPVFTHTHTWDVKKSWFFIFPCIAQLWCLVNPRYSGQ